MNYERDEFVDAGQFLLSDLSVQPVRSHIEVRGMMASTFAQDHNLVDLIVVFFDASGNPLFAEREFIGLVEGGGSTLFAESVFLDESAPAWDHVEVYGHP